MRHLLGGTREELAQYAIFTKGQIRYLLTILHQAHDKMIDAT